MTIKVLDKITAEQIAAGEVIETPASVVKELVENSLDARASQVTVAIEEGGKKLIRVSDNGFGIKAAELPLAFQRFATSKLQSFTDLDHLKSLGFRGEALPSIAAVARVKMTTRIADEVAGCEITFAGGDAIKQVEQAAPPGTVVEVSDLFYNTPGRLKFLRAASYESSRISSLLSEIALANPGVKIVLTSGSRTLFRSTGDGNLLNTIGALYGSEIAEAMLRIEKKEKQNDIFVEGYTSAPYLTRSSRKWITLIVNGRLINNAMLVSALERAYGDLLPSRRHPLAVIRVNLAPHLIDVNVHPAKIEIRFAEPEPVKTLLFRAVRLALQSQKPLRALEACKYPELNKELKEIFSEEHYKTALTQDRFNYQNYLDHNRDRSLEKTQSPVNAGTRPENLTGGEVCEGMKADSYCHLIGQYLNSYLVVQRGSDLLLIDQHAAHERIIYHRLQTREEEQCKKESGSQLTIPLPLQLPPQWQEKFTQLLPLLRAEGYEFETLGESHYVIRAVPFLAGGNLGEHELQDFLERLFNSDQVTGATAREAMLKTLACHRSVKAGQALSNTEMKELLAEWEKTPSAEYCPHGRPTVLIFERSRLEKGFNRGGGSH